MCWRRPTARSEELGAELVAGTEPVDKRERHERGDQEDGWRKKVEGGDEAGWVEWPALHVESTLRFEA